MLCLSPLNLCVLLYLIVKTQKMVQALLCAQDWLKPNSRLDVDDYFEELQNLENGSV